jgi:FAD/FMN-containing dehydrogenase
MQGRLILPGEEGYEESRRIWNGMFDRHPAAIAQCVNVDDVKAAVSFARENRVLVAVRGGGHSIPGHSTCDDGLVIDLSTMKAITVDPAARTVRAEGGVQWGELDSATQAHGLAVTGGTNSDTGIAGLTLGGGIGWLQRAFGLACDNLLAADVVTADGQLVHASPDDHPDLLWALRGGGGNFGVVTAFEFRLHPVGPTVLAGAILYPLDQARDVVGFQRDFLPGAPDELMVMNAYLTVPPVAPFPEPIHNMRLLFVVAAYAGDVGAGERAVAPMRQVGKPIADVIQPLPYTEHQKSLDGLTPRGIRCWSRYVHLRSLDDMSVETVTEWFDRVPSSFSYIVAARMDGAVSRVAPDATAFPHRGSDSLVWIASHWPDATDDAVNIAWTRGCSDALEPQATGSVYVNALADEGASYVRSAYTGATYDRLVEIKRRYDPANLFRLNHNIQP